MKVYKLIEESCLGSIEIIKNEINSLVDGPNCNYKLITETKINIKNNCIKIQSDVQLKTD